MAESIHDVGAQLAIDDCLAADLPREYLARRIGEMEKDAIYQAVKQAGVTDGWVCVRPEVVSERDLLRMATIFSVRVHCRAVRNVPVYIPVYEARQMPRDVYSCRWCGGLTRNDKRGNCAACGAPRDERYLEREVTDGRD